jgi:hypothetical protein
LIQVDFQHFFAELRVVPGQLGAVPPGDRGMGGAGDQGQGFCELSTIFVVFIHSMLALLTGSIIVV